MKSPRKPNWPAILKRRLEAHAIEARLALAADFISRHANDRHFYIGGIPKNGWVMQHACDLIESQEGEIRLPAAWLPGSVRENRAESFAWKKGEIESDYPNPD